MENGEVQSDVVAQWAANAPLAMALALDAGAQDQPIAGPTRAFSEILPQYDIDHTAKIYDPGAHVSRIDERVEEHVLPFFTEHLAVPE